MVDEGKAVEVEPAGDLSPGAEAGDDLAGSPAVGQRRPRRAFFAGLAAQAKVAGAFLADQRHRVGIPFLDRGVDPDDPALPVEDAQAVLDAFEHARQEPLAFLELLLGFFPVDGHGDLVADELEEVLLLLAVPDPLRIRLDGHDADRLPVDDERRAQPVDRRRPDQVDLVELPEPDENLRGGEQRLAGPQDILRESPARGLGGGGAVAFIHEIGEAQDVPAAVVESGVEIPGRDEPGDRLVNRPEELVQVLRRIGRRRDPHDGGVDFFHPLPFRSLQGQGQYISHGDGEMLLLKSPGPGRAGVLVAENTDDPAVPPDGDVHHRGDAFRLEIAFGEFLHPGVGQGIIGGDDTAFLERAEITRVVAGVERRSPPVQVLASPVQVAAVDLRVPGVEEPDADPLHFQGVGGDLRDGRERRLEIPQVEVGQLQQGGLMLDDLGRPFLQPLLFLFFSGDVQEAALVVGDPASVIKDDPDIVLDPNDVTVGLAELEFEIPENVVLLEKVDGMLADNGIEIEVLGVLPESLLTSPVSQHLSHGRVEVEDLAPGRRPIQAHGYLLEESAVLVTVFSRSRRDAARMAGQRLSHRRPGLSGSQFFHSPEHSQPLFLIFPAPFSLPPIPARAFAAGHSSAVLRA